MRREEKTQQATRRVTTGAAVGTLLGVFVCWPWDMFAGVSRPWSELAMPLLPLTLSFTLMGALAGAIFSIAGDDAPS